MVGSEEGWGQGPALGCTAHCTRVPLVEGIQPVYLIVLRPFQAAETTLILL